jgi:hypothetical protein
LIQECLNFHFFYAQKDITYREILLKWNTGLFVFMITITTEAGGLNNQLKAGIVIQYRPALQRRQRNPSVRRGLGFPENSHADPLHA